MVAHLVQRTDARMREARDGAGFVREARPATRIGCSVRREHFEGDMAIESRVAGLVDLAHPACADKIFDVENPEPHPTRQRRRGGCRLVRVRRGGSSRTAGKEALGVAVCREQRLHLLAQVRILATLVREKRRTLGLRPCKGRVEEGEDVFPTVGGHSRSFMVSDARCGSSACVTGPRDLTESRSDHSLQVAEQPCPGTRPVTLDRCGR